MAMNANTTRTRKVLSLLMVCVLALLAGALATAAPANAAAAGSRYAGATRYDTAISVSTGWKSATTAIIASGQNFPDALAAAPLSKAYDAPILLTDNRAPTEQKIVARMSALGVTRAIIVGGESAVRPGIVTNLKAKGIASTRLAGASRYATAVAAAEQLGARKPFDTVFIASGQNFPDALSAAPVAAINGWPMLLTDPGNPRGISTETANFIKAKKIPRVVILGGTGVITDTAANSLKHSAGVSSIKRIAGANRYATAVNVYLSYKPIFTTANFSLATGQNFPDALAGCALSAKLNAPLFLLDSSAVTTVKPVLAGFARTGALIFGGTGVLPDANVNAIFAPAANAVVAPAAKSIPSFVLNGAVTKAIFYVPHGDDETLFYSQTVEYTINKLGAQNVFLVLMTDGAGSAVGKSALLNPFVTGKAALLTELRTVNPSSSYTEDMVRRAVLRVGRDNEFVQAAAALGVPTSNILRLEDDLSVNGIKRLTDGALNQQAASTVMQECNRTGVLRASPTEVIAHFSYSPKYENHKDHLALGAALRDARLDRSVKYYIVRGDIAQPTTPGVLVLSANPSAAKIRSAWAAYTQNTKTAAQITTANNTIAVTVATNVQAYLSNDAMRPADALNRALNEQKGSLTKLGIGKASAPGLFSSLDARLSSNTLKTTLHP